MADVTLVGWSPAGQRVWHLYERARDAWREVGRQRLADDGDYYPAVQEAARAEETLRQQVEAMDTEIQRLRVANLSGADLSGADAKRGDA